MLINIVLLKICVFGFAVGLNLIGLFLCLDAFIPKETAISNWGVLIELLMGAALLGTGIFLGSRFRIKTARTGNDEQRLPGSVSNK